MKIVNRERRIATIIAETQVALGDINERLRVLEAKRILLEENLRRLQALAAYQEAGGRQQLII